MIKQLIIDGKKSYDDFGLLIASRNISQPKKKVVKESVPFSNVVYDFSKLNGEIYWEERTLQYTFDIAEITTEEMEVVKSNAYSWLMNVHDTDIYDPYIEGYHFHGSFDSDSWSEDFGAGTITITFSVYPYKISNVDNTITSDEVGISTDGTLDNSVASVVKKLSIDGKSIQDIKTVNMRLYDTGNTNLSGETLIVDFGSYTSDELLKAIGVKSSNGSMTAETMSEYGYFGMDDSGQPTDDTIILVGMTGTMIEMFGITLDVEDFTAQSYYLLMVKGTNFFTGEITPIANVSTLTIYDNFVFPSNMTSNNMIEAYTDGIMGSVEIDGDNIIWDCLLLDIVQEIVPTPNTPIEIKSLGDNKNLWSLGNQDNLSGDIEFSLTEGKYVLSFIKSRISNSTITNNQLYRYVYIKFYDENDTLLSTINDTTTIKLTAGQTSDRLYIKFTAPENTTKIIVNFGNNNGDNNRNTNVIDIKIEKGSIGTVYSEYGYGGLEVISTGKNLLNIYEVEENATDVYEVLSNDWIHYANTSGNAKRIFFKKFKVKPNTTYYLNYELEEGQGEDITFLYQYDENGNSTMIHYPSSSIFITTLENTKYAKIGVTTQSQSAIDDYKIRLMFVESSVKDNVYEAYKRNKVTINTSEVCSINDIKEELIINGNSAKIKKKFAKLILTGNEANYSLVASNSNENFIQMNLFLNPSNVDSRNAGSYVMSTHFEYMESASTPNKTKAGFRSYDKNVLVFSIPTEIATDVATWKQYLKDLYSNGNPVIIYYLLNEYYEVELDDVSSISTYKGSTTINIDSNLETTFEVGYYEPPKTITINNNSSHRIMPTITSTGEFTIELNGISYSIGEGTYTNTFYLVEGKNNLTISGYGEITFSYVEEVF